MLENVIQKYIRNILERYYTRHVHAWLRGKAGHMLPVYYKLVPGVDGVAVVGGTANK